MKQPFLLTYSVKTTSHRDTDKNADKFRELITAGFLCHMDKSTSYVKKHPTVETSISGMISISGSTETEKKQHIETVIRDGLKSLMKGHDIPAASIEIHCVILAGSLPSAFEFKI
ncbi:hypothetical protein AAIB98_004226 [Providencia rettgeri]